MPRDTNPIGIESLPDTIQISPGHMEVRFQTVVQLAETMYALARILENDGNCLTQMFEPAHDPPGDLTYDNLEVLFLELSGWSKNEAGKQFNVTDMLGPNIQIKTRTLSSMPPPATVVSATRLSLITASSRRCQLPSASSPNFIDSEESLFSLIRSWFGATCWAILIISSTASCACQLSCCHALIGPAATRRAAKLSDFVLGDRSQALTSVVLCISDDSGKCLSPSIFPTGPNPGNCHGLTDASFNQCQASNQYDLQLVKAGFQSFPTPTAGELNRLTELVSDNNHFQRYVSEDDRETMQFLRKKIKHVIYNIKENRTYD